MRPNTAAIRSNREDVRLFYAEQPHVEPIICAATGKACDPRCNNRCRLSLRDQALVDSIAGNGPPANDTPATRTHTAVPGHPGMTEADLMAERAASAEVNGAALTVSTTDASGIWCGNCSGDERCRGCGKADEPSVSLFTESVHGVCESCWPESCAATAPIVRYDTIDRTASGDGISCRHCKGYTQAPAKWADHLGEPVLCVCARCRSCGERAHVGLCRTSLFSRGFARIEHI